MLTGAWLGLFIGLVLGFFSPSPWGALVTGLVAGVFFGLITSAIPYAMARGTRDFSSTMQLVAGRYDVLCDPQNAEHGRDLLARLTICAISPRATVSARDTPVAAGTLRSLAIE